MHFPDQPMPEYSPSGLQGLTLNVKQCSNAEFYADMIYLRPPSKAKIVRQWIGGDQRQLGGCFIHLMRPSSLDEGRKNSSRIYFCVDTMYRRPASKGRTSWRARQSDEGGKCVGDSWRWSVDFTRLCIFDEYLESSINMYFCANMMYCRTANRTGDNISSSSNGAVSISGLPEGKSRSKTLKRVDVSSSPEQDQTSFEGKTRRRWRENERPQTLRSTVFLRRYAF
ncbi:hypothetical protein IW262DRAFT_1554232 [Armillaria fumosa]|nr:hypothetical protein IW262DRAFT_1554232 [Armillaria fumosa]